MENPWKELQKERERLSNLWLAQERSIKTIHKLEAKIKDLELEKAWRREAEGLYIFELKAQIAELEEQVLELKEEKKEFVSFSEEK